MIKSHKKVVALLIIVSIIYSCGNSSKKENQESNKEVNQLNVIKNTTGTINNTISLMEMTPISYEFLEQWFPKNLLNMQLSNIEKGSLSGNNITSSVAHYKGPNNASFDIIINDAAGKNGSIVVGSFSIYKNMTVDREDDYKIEKSFKKNKMAGIETYHKKRKESLSD